MKKQKHKNGLAKPWGRSRIPVAPAGIRHKSAKDYDRNKLPAIEQEWNGNEDSDAEDYYD